MIRDLIRAYLVNSAGVPAEKLDDMNVMMVDLGLDSLGVVEMLFEIEEKYGFHLADVMKYKTMTLEEVITDLESVVAGMAAEKGQSLGSAEHTQAA